MDIRTEARAVNATMALTHFAQMPIREATAAAAILSDSELAALESILRKLAGAVPGTNGSADFAEAVRTYVPPTGPLQIVRERDTVAAEGPSAAFGWRKIGKGENVRYEGSYGGLKLEIQRAAGPKADYTGFVDGRKVHRSKFKSKVREHVEREALKRAK
jgi:hypothetical protein